MTLGTSIFSSADEVACPPPPLRRDQDGTAGLSRDPRCTRDEGVMGKPSFTLLQAHQLNPGAFVHGGSSWRAQSRRPRLVTWPEAPRLALSNLSRPGEGGSFCVPRPLCEVQTEEGEGWAVSSSETWMPEVARLTSAGGGAGDVARSR